VGVMTVLTALTRPPHRPGRGPQLRLSAPRGTVSILKYAEGDVRIQCAAVRAKMIKGSNIDVASDDGTWPSPRLAVDIEALFGNQSRVRYNCTPKRAEGLTVKVARSHGHLEVTSGKGRPDRSAS
jgi:hypothetical protein